MLTLKRLQAVSKKINMRALCEGTGVRVVTIAMKTSRSSPELSVVESQKLTAAIRSLIKDLEAAIKPEED